MLPTLTTIAALGYTLAPAGGLARHRPVVMSADADISRSGLSRRQAVQTAALVGVAQPAMSSATDYKRDDGAPYPQMKITTTAGVMEFELWDDVAPKHVASFLKLTKTGFFDGGAFHRIIPGFVIQGGDPNVKVGYGPGGTLDGADKGAVRKWGTGGPGYNVPAEFNPRKHEFGVLSMARAADPNSAGSQFFVCLGDLPSLDNKYTTFGKLLKGDDVLRKIAAAKTVQGDIPFERQGIERVDAL